jgi:hypothetical protein
MVSSGKWNDNASLAMRSCHVCEGPGSIVSAGCYNPPTDCDDGNPCTVDSCSAVASCPNGVLQDGKCYRGYPTNVVYWPQANSACIAKGGTLAVAASAAKTQAIRAAADLRCVTGAQAFIGLSDAAVEGAFQWVDGSVPGYTNWGPSQPDNSDGGDYVEIRADGKWYDQQVHFTVQRWCYVCQLPPEPAGECGTSPSLASGCVPGECCQKGSPPPVFVGEAKCPTNLACEECVCASALPNSLGGRNCCDPSVGWDESCNGAAQTQCYKVCTCNANAFNTTCDQYKVFGKCKDVY